MTEEETTEEEKCTCDQCVCPVCEEEVQYCECTICEYCGDKFDIQVGGEYCGECGQCFCSDCENACGCGYCGECGESEDYCECGGGFGTSHSPPWEKRGITVNTKGSQSHWQSLFPELAQFDPVQTAANFYLLESIANDVPFVNERPAPVRSWVADPEVDRKIAAILDLTEGQLDFWVGRRNKAVKPSKTAELMAEAKVAFHSLVEYADANLVPYFHMAIGGELRHHQAVGGGTLSSNRNYAWHGWMEVFEKVGNGVYLDAAELFREFSGGSYGGENWAIPSEIFHSRLEGKYSPKGDADDFTNKQIFVDRAWTLEHNGGCFLNKISWAKKAGNKIGNVNHMQKLLNAHASDPTEYPTLIEAASSEVKKMFRQYWKESIAELKEAGFEVGADTETMLLAKPKPRCRYCGSNPTIGHTMQCEWVLTKRTTGTCSEVVEPENQDLVAWTHWVKDDSMSTFNQAGIKTYFFDKVGEIRGIYPMNGGQRMTVRFNIEVPGYGTPTYKWEGDLASYMAGHCTFSVEEIVAQCGVDKAMQDRALEAFQQDITSLKMRFRWNGDESFGEFHDFNPDTGGGTPVVPTVNQKLNFAKDDKLGRFLMVRFANKLGVTI